MNDKCEEADIIMCFKGSRTNTCCAISIVTGDASGNSVQKNFWVAGEVA